MVGTNVVFVEEADVCAENANSTANFFRKKGFAMRMKGE